MIVFFFSCSCVVLGGFVVGGVKELFILFKVICLNFVCGIRFGKVMIVFRICFVIYGCDGFVFIRYD